MMFYDSLVHCICSQEILSTHVAVGIAERKTFGGVFHRSCNQYYTFGITAEVMRLNMLKLSLCLMTYYSGLIPLYSHIRTV